MCSLGGGGLLSTYMAGKREFIGLESGRYSLGFSLILYLGGVE